MTDQHDFERIVADSVHGIGPLTPSDGALDRTMSRVSQKRQRPEWLALIKEPPMRTGNQVAVGSPAVRVAAITVATLLLAVALAAAGAGAQRLLAAEGPIVVAQDGTGTVTTIGEAVTMAEDGDEILVEPGTYTESVTVESDIVIRGDGDPSEIVVMAPEDGPTAPTHSESSAEPYALLVSDNEATISGLTFAGEPSLVIVSGGSPTVADSIFDGVGWAFGTSGITQDGSSIVATAGTTASIHGNTIVDGGPIAVFGMASPTVEANVLRDGPHIYLAEHGPTTEVRDNEISGTLVRGIGVSSPGPVLIAGNRITDATGIGIRVGNNTGAEGWEPTIRDNVVEATVLGIDVTAGGAPIVEGNTIRGARTGIYAARTGGAYSDNTIEENFVGISLVLGDDAPPITDNTISHNDVGLVANGAGTFPILSGNTICDNANFNMRLGDDVTPPVIDESNDICENPPAE